MKYFTKSMPESTTVGEAFNSFERRASDFAEALETIHSDSYVAVGSGVAATISGEAAFDGPVVVVEINRTRHLFKPGDEAKSIVKALRDLIEGACGKCPTCHYCYALAIEIEAAAKSIATKH